MEIFLAFDGGQSHSLAIVADAQGTIHAVQPAGPCNHFDEPGGEERFRETLIQTTQKVLQQAGMQGDQVIQSACYGLTGYWERAAEILRPRFPFASFTAVEDVETAQAAAFGGGAGIVLIAGTGAVSYGLTAENLRARSGGWGYLMADEGSGYAIGRRALQAVSKAYDGRGLPTVLLQHLLEHFQQPDFLALHRLIYQGPIARHEIANLAKVVVGAATQGDLVATQILDEAAAELAMYVVAVARQLGWKDPPVSAVGGVFRAGEIILEPFRRHLGRALPGAHLQTPAFPQVIGALLIAYRASGYPIDQALLQTLQAQTNRQNLWQFG